MNMSNTFSTMFFTVAFWVFVIATMGYPATYSGDNRLQPHHRGSCHDHGIDARLGIDPVGPASKHANLKAIGGRSDYTGTPIDSTGREAHDVLPQHDSRFWKSFEHPVINHRPGALRSLLAWLKYGHQCPFPGVAPFCKKTCCADQAGNMHVVPARMGHRDDPAGWVSPSYCAGVWKTSRFLDGKGIHVGTQHYRWAIAVPQDPHNSGLADPPGYLKTHVFR